MPPTKRQRDLERSRQLRAAQRRAEAARKRRRIQLIAGGVAATLIIVVVAVIIGTRGSGTKTASPAAGAAASASATPSGAPSGATTATPSAPVSATASGGGGTPVCDFRADPSGGGKHVALPPDAKATADATLALDTSQGPITLRLDHGKAPCTTTALVHLAKVGYYDGTTCHRLTTSGIFVVQCGDPTGMGSGGPGFSQQEEGLTGATYPRGTVAMAKTSAPHSTGAQFFLVYKDGSGLSADYTPVGTITKGLDAIDKVAAAGVKPGGSPGDGAPTLPLDLKKVTVAS